MSLLAARRITNRRILPLAVVCTFLVFPLAPVWAAQPDFAAARDEIVQILIGFIRVDTSSPPGNETKGAQYLKAFLDREGIPSEIIEGEPGRGNLVARLKGSGKKKPLLLMGHIDVVGVERDKWSVDPFAGIVKDGYIWGRGTADDKGMTSVCLEIMMLLKRLNVPLDRDVIFLAEAGEEGATHVGIDFMVQKHWEKIECEFAINEGGGIREADGKVQYVGVSTTEKVPRSTFLYAKGTSGHGSRPLLDNAIIHIADAVAKVGKWQPPARLNDTTRTFFARLAEISPPDEAFLYRNVEDATLGPLAQEKLRASKPGYNSMMRTSVTPTVIEGGFRINVIPGEARARLDIRALPDEDMDAFADALRHVISNPRIEVVTSQGSRKAAAPSRMDTEMFLALERAQRKVFPGAATLPIMLTGATDSAQLRAKGVQAYGTGNVHTEEDSMRVHGHDERTSVKGLGQFVEFLWTAVTDVAEAKPR